MKQYKLQALFAGFAVTGLLFFVAAPVALAHADHEKGDNFGGLSKVDRTHVEERITEIKAQAKLKLAERRAGREAKTVERRQQVCENRKTSITNKINAFSKSGENILTRFDDVYDRVKDFKTDKQLEVSNYDELIAAADAKQQAATEAVAALKDLTADFDCTTTDPAQTVASIKTATSDAKTSLKEYRKSIKDIVVALAQVNKTSDDQSDDTTDDTSTTTPDTTTDNTTEEQ